MSDLDSALEWVEYAEEDFLMAKTALRRKKPLITASCFHSQQCAENGRRPASIVNRAYYANGKLQFISGLFCMLK